MATVTQKFVLVGPHAGKSMAVNGHDFVDGAFVFTGSAEQVATLARVFSHYAALPEQEAELEALRAEKASAPTVPVDGPEVPAAASALADALSMSLGEAIGQLNPENDAHWTSNNLPAIETLSEMTGKKVTRSDVDAVADGYTRAKARAAKQ